MVAVSTCVFIATIAIIVVVSTAGTAAAATASALLLKYGLQCRTGLSKLEDNLEKMCSEELIQVKDAPDMSLQECVEFVIQKVIARLGCVGIDKNIRKFCNFIGLVKIPEILKRMSS